MTTAGRYITLVKPFVHQGKSPCERFAETRGATIAERRAMDVP